MAYDIFDLQGTPAQNAIILDALKRCDFPWEKLVAKLQATKGKSKIPVIWEDCNRYAAKGLEQAKAGQDDGHDHSHEESTETETTHHHVTDDDGVVLAHGVGFRSRILGLAWYSGKVSVDISLESNPVVAQEVFLSEGAHMVDFFFMTDEHRTKVSNAFHGSETAPAEHGHGWFDQGDYYSWVGEAFMGGFVKAYSDVPVTIDFVHPPTAYTKTQIRQILTPAPAAPKTPGGGVVEPPFQEEPLVSTRFSTVFHKKHAGIRPFTTWTSREQALAARKRPCTVCRP